jgi:hypothetical protein
LLALPISGALSAYYNDPALARDNYRGLMRHVRASWQEGDAIIANAPGQVEMLQYYNRTSLPIYPLPRQRPMDEEQTAGDLRQVFDNHRRLWLVLWATANSDPNGFIEGWYDTRAFKTTNRWYGTIRLALYSFPRSGSGDMTALQARFGDLAELTGYRLDPPQVAPGDTLQLGLRWKPLAETSQRYKVFAHVLGPEDYLWGQQDSEPVGGNRPTTTWKTGEEIADRIGVAVPLGTPPGEYRVEVGLYRLDNGERLPVFDPFEGKQDTRVLFPPVRIVRPATPLSDTLSVQNRLSLDLKSGLRLLGYDLTRYGSDSTDLRAGEVAGLTLFWQASNDMERTQGAQVELLDGSGKVVATHEAPLVLGGVRGERWQKGEVVRDQRRLPLPPPGEYTLRLSLLYDMATKAQGTASAEPPVVLGKVRLKP